MGTSEPERRPPPRIVFVHGMGEKPEPEAERLRMWGALAQSLWLPIPYEAFRVAYWSDVREPRQELQGSAPSGKLVLELPSRQRAQLGWTFAGLGAYVGRPDLLVLNVIERSRQVMQTVLQGGSARAERRVRGALSSMMRDLEPYLEGQTREAILSRVVGCLDKERDQPLCILSHSMGTIVALDAVLHWDGEVDTFVTLGAPLGWEYLKQWMGRPAYPSNVRRWYNLFDRLDNVALPDRRIRDDYPAADGGRPIIDRVVRDNFSVRGDRDPHHWFGYLTSPELGDIVCHFWLGASGRAPRQSDQG